MLGNGDKARALQAVMASMMVAMAKAQAWRLQLLQRGPSSIQSVTSNAAGCMAGFGSGLRAPGAAPGGVGVCFACAVYAGAGMGPCVRAPDGGGA